MTFKELWHERLSAIKPNQNEDQEEHVKRVCELAYFKAQEETKNFLVNILGYSMDDVNVEEYITLKMAKEFAEWYSNELKHRPFYWVGKSVDDALNFYKEIENGKNNAS